MMQNASFADSPPKIPIIYPPEMTTTDINYVNMRSIYYQSEKIEVISADFDAQRIGFVFIAKGTQSYRTFLIEDATKFAQSIHYSLQKPVMSTNESLMEFESNCRQFLEEMINSAVKHDEICKEFFLTQK